MDQTARRLRDLAANLLRPDRAQISHGLNLMLRLRDDAVMWKLLAQIRIKQRKIDDGLGELNFVHFARFLPSHDMKALQVITEFDGPLAPYVLDFAIEIGDVFDLLLSHTLDTEHIVPIANHPAEFLAFVEKHNAVHVPELGSIADWPLYSAYPEQTVLDLTGARDDLPIPKADRWATDVARDDVQCNVLRGFHGERVRHFVLSVVDAAKSRAWLADQATANSAAAMGFPRVTPSTEWTTKPALAVNIGLTHAGMIALGVRASWLASFPTAFVEGALARAEGNFDTGINAPEHWWFGGAGQASQMHMLVSLYQAPGAGDEFEAAAAALVASLAGGGLRLLVAHDAWHNGGRSWFGYVDGIAQPRIAEACPERSRDDDFQPATTAGEFVLGAHYKNIYGGDSLGRLPAALASNGAFCAVRVLEQRADDFRATLDAEAHRLTKPPEWLAAKLMGRWIEGAPASLHPDVGPPTGSAEHLRNDFDYAPSYEYSKTPIDHAGMRCPVGAHIRRTNPRTSRVAGARYTRRLMRRGMHYDITDVSDQRQVGLFGMFICADLERQFEFIQREWINGDRFAEGLRGTRDPFVGTPPDGRPHEFEIPMTSEPALKVRLAPFVRTRGSLYLFMPGLQALRQMDRFATTDLSAPAAVAVVSSPLIDEWARVGDLMASLSAALATTTGARISGDELLDIAQAGIGNLGGNDIAPAVDVPTSRLRFNPRRRDFQIDPYPVYAAFRKSEPVHYSPLYGGWFVLRYHDVVRVCKENDHFSASPLGSNWPRGLLNLDDPEHAQVLMPIAAAWRNAAVDLQQLVNRSIENTLAALHSRPCFDLVDDFARPVPRDVFFDLLGGRGISAQERLEIDALARTVMKHQDNLLDNVQQLPGLLAASELLARLGLMLLAARAPWSPFKGSFLAHLALDVGRPPLTWPVALLTLLNITVAGYMSVEFLLATGIRRLLLDRAGLWKNMRQGGFLDKCLEEMRRTAPVLSVVDRFARHDVHIGGVQVLKGDRVFGVLASANRDERVYGRTADSFDPQREWPEPHLGFGPGVHYCLGRHTEPLISAPAIRALHDAMPDLRLQSFAEPPWFQNFYFRSFDSIAVTSK
jgi:cytochrome P450/deferrochelatase/peroxidase EfeB